MSILNPLINWDHLNRGFGFGHLEGGEKKVAEELGETQGDGGLCGLVRDEDEDHLMDAQQRNQG